MTLVEELAAERESIINDARALMSRITGEAKIAVEQSGSCMPVVAALDGAIPEFFHPTWKDDYAKQQAFKHINEALADRPINATVYSFPAEVSFKGASPERAIVVIAHTAAWKEMQVHPFRVTHDSVKWAKPIIQNGFTAHLLSLPYGKGD